MVLGYSYSISLPYYEITVIIVYLKWNRHLEIKLIIVIFFKILINFENDSIFGL